jgi:hypothetical protein
MMERAIGLTDSQLALLRRYAAVLPVAKRGEFVAEVMRRLGEQPSTPALEAAVSLAFGCAPELESEGV